MRSSSLTRKQDPLGAAEAIRWIVLLVILLTATAASFAQSSPPPDSNPPPPPPPKQKFFFGGGIGLSFGQVDYVELAPLIGYRFLPKLDGGLQLIYQYQHDSRYAETLTFNNYGANVFARYFVVPTIFAEAEYQYLNYEYPLATLDTARSTYNTFLAGGGYSAPMGHGAGFYFSALYDFSYNSSDLHSPYTDPWVLQAGVTVGF